MFDRFLDVCVVFCGTFTMAVDDKTKYERQGNDVRKSRASRGKLKLRVGSVNICVAGLP